MRKKIFWAQFFLYLFYQYVKTMLSEYVGKQKNTSIQKWIFDFCAKSIKIVNKQFKKVKKQLYEYYENLKQTWVFVSYCWQSIQAFFFVFWKKTLVIRFPYMEIVWLACFWWRRQTFFVFFFNRKLIFVFKQTFFEKKKFCMQNLIFCVYNVVLDILILDFFFLFSS